MATRWLVYNGSISKIRINNSVVPDFVMKVDHTLYLRAHKIWATQAESRTRVLGQLPPGQLPPGQLPPDNYPPDNYPPRTNTPRTITPPQITEFPKHKSTKFTSHKVYKSQKVHKLRGQSHNIYEYKFYKIQVSTKVVHGYGKLWSFGGF